MCNTKESHTNLTSNVSTADLMREVIEKLNRLEQMLSAKHDTWGTVSYIKNHFHISYQQARKLCSTPGVRCHKAPHSWTKYSVDDCTRIFAAEIPGGGRGRPTGRPAAGGVSLFPLQKECSSLV